MLLTELTNQWLLKAQAGCIMIQPYIGDLMQVPKIIRGCESVRSLFWQFFRVAGKGLLHESACKCCVFYRGALIACLFLAPSIAVQATNHKVWAIFIAAGLAIVIAGLAKLLDEEDDYE